MGLTAPVFAPLEGGSNGSARLMHWRSKPTETSSNLLSQKVVKKGRSSRIALFFCSTQSGESLIAAPAGSPTISEYHETRNSTRRRAARRTDHLPSGYCCVRSEPRRPPHHRRGLAADDCGSDPQCRERWDRDRSRLDDRIRMRRLVVPHSAGENIRGHPFGVLPGSRGLSRGRSCRDPAPRAFAPRLSNGFARVAAENQIFAALIENSLDFIGIADA